MFSIFYAGSVEKAETDVDCRERTEHGWKMADLHMGLDFYLNQGHKSPHYGNLLETHTKIGDTTLKLHEIFQAFQGEFCGDEFRKIISEVGATHTSMSVGDIIVDRCGGQMYFCDSCGFTKLEG